MGELDEIRQRYAARAKSTSDLYSVMRHDAHVAQFHVERATLAVLRAAGLDDFGALRVLEVGCGNGSNLLRLIRWGFEPSNLVANELLPTRLEVARRNLPEAVQVLAGDARQIDHGGSFDIVLQSTVLSSILDDDFQLELAQTMWRLVRPGGAVLSYDFAVNNPKNKDVRGVPVKRLEQIFPEYSRIDARKVTLAPPVARRLRGSRAAYAVLNAVPVLRTHRVVLLTK